VKEKLKGVEELGVVVHAYNHSTQAAEADHEFKSSLGYTVRPYPQK
jgi:hypothetical protein